jgi:hypothetical protein
VVKIDGDTGAETTLTEIVDYTLTGAGETAGGTATLHVGATAGDIYLRKGQAGLERMQSIARNGKFRSRPIDDDIDRRVIVEQEQARDLDRALKLKLGSAAPADLAPGEDNALLIWRNGALANGPVWGEGEAGIPGPGIIPGGAAGKILTKASGADYDFIWADPTASTGIMGDRPANIPVNLYTRTDALGLSQYSIIADTDQTIVDKDRYALFIGQYTAGTGDPDVIGSTWGLGITAIKKNWHSTAVAGQFLGISVVTRSGYTGVNPGGSTGAGDTAAFIANVAQADTDNYAAVLEGIAYYMPGGVFNAAGQKSIKVQVGAIKDSQALAIGVVAIGVNGALGAAFQAQNTIGGAGPDSNWLYFLRYVPNFGLGAYESWVVNQSGWQVMNNGPAASTPNVKKTIRVGDTGKLEIVNSAGTTVIWSLNDTGGINIAAGQNYAIANVQVLGPRRTGWTADTGTAKRTANATYSGTAGGAYDQTILQTLMNAVRDNSQTLKALKDDFIAHGAIGT